MPMLECDVSRPLVHRFGFKDTVSNDQEKQYHEASKEANQFDLMSKRV